MLIGVFAGFAAALFQSSSYLFSRQYVLRHGSPLLLIVYSQLLMGAISACALPFLAPWGGYMLSGEFFLCLFGSLAMLAIGQFAFFQALRTIEASRISSLLGLKIVLLALLCMILRDGGVTPMQWLAVFLSAAAAMGMNWSGGRFTLSGCCYLALALFVFCWADLAEYRLIHMAESGNLVRDAIGMTALSYFTLGVCTLPFLPRVRRSARLLRDAAPYSVVWLAAMAALFTCYGTLDVVFGNVIQSFRGVISVGLGIVLARLGFGRLEPKAIRSILIRRWLSAAGMMAAIALYAFGSAKTGAESVSSLETAVEASPVD